MRMLFAAMLIVSALSGCAAQPIAMAVTNNPEVRTELLFEHEGCRMYRFHDGVLPVYYADCSHTVSTAWRVSCGRNCTRPMMISTAR